MASGLQIGVMTAFAVGITLLTMRLAITGTDRKRVAALNTHWVGKLKFFWARGGIQLRANCLNGFNPTDSDLLDIARVFFLDDKGETRDTFHRFISFYKSDGALLCFATPAYLDEGFSLCLFQQKSLFSAELVPIKQLRFNSNPNEGAV